MRVSLSPQIDFWFPIRVPAPKLSQYLVHVYRRLKQLVLSRKVKQHAAMTFNSNPILCSMFRLTRKRIMYRPHVHKLPVKALVTYFQERYIQRNAEKVGIFPGMEWKRLE